MDLDERKLTVKITGKAANNWFLDLNVSEKAKLPFKTIGNAAVSCQFQGLNYAVTTPNGKFSDADKGNVFRISPKVNTLTLNFAGDAKW